MTDVDRRIDDILNDASLDCETEDTCRSEEIEKLIPQYGWQAIQEYLFTIFRDNARPPDHWLVAAEVFYAVLGRQHVEANRLIASVYCRLPPDPDSTESNLAWSIACTLKEVSYLSDYDPLQDPAIKAELARIEKPS